MISAYIATLCILLFLLPTFIAFHRKLPYAGYVAAANIAAGWTIATWLALMWYCVRTKSNG